MNRIEQAAVDARLRVQKAQKKVPFSEMHRQAMRVRRMRRRPFAEALKRPGFHWIGEVSQALSGEEFPCEAVAKRYEAAGACAVSCVTEPKYFQGKGEYLQRVAAAVHVPVLCWDVVVDEYMIYEARTLGADAVTLICAVLDNRTLSRCLSVCAGLGVSALVEVSDEEELRAALGAGARLIGVNGRSPETGQADIQTALRLRPLIPADIPVIAMNGAATPEDIAALKRADVNGMIAGEIPMVPEGA